MPPPSLFRLPKSPVQIGLKVLHFGNDQDMTIQQEFFDCRCDIVFILYSDNFLTKGCTKNLI